MESLSSGFRRVDETDDAGSCVRYLDLVHSLPFFRNCKLLSYEKCDLSSGERVLEIGCGNGTDAQNLTHITGPSGHVIGIDVSGTMLKAARSQALSSPLCPDFLLCDGQYLAFPDATFHAVRSDRVIQHTRDPSMVIAEMARILCPGGRIVIFEPDWETLTLWPGNREITRKILNFWCDAIPSGWVGRTVMAACSRAGLDQVTVQPLTLTITDLTYARKLFDLDRTFSLVVQRGICTQADVMRWDEDLTRADREGQFFSSLTFFLVTGKKPE